MQRLQVNQATGRFLELANGEAFFWLGDTAWELVHRLDREETQYYMQNRVQKGFNIIHTVLLGELDGLREPNAYGRLPLLRDANGAFDPAQPDTATGDNGYSYWDHADYVLSMAEQLGLYVALLPTWGDKWNLLWGIGPELFTKENAYAYARFVGERYANRDNIVWVLGGDRPMTLMKHFEVVYALARGLRDAGATQLMTYHPPGGASSSLYCADAPWLDFHMQQTGHDPSRKPVWEISESDYALWQIKPFVNGEPCYEDMPVSQKPELGYFDAVDVRHAVYESVFSGACGVSYGNNSIWKMCRSEEIGSHAIMDWKSALDRPGAEQMIHLRNLMDQYLARGGVPAQQLLKDNPAGANRASAIRGIGFAMVYIPNGIQTVLDMTQLGNDITAQWYNPSTGSRMNIGAIPNNGKFAPPTAGRGCDWVLILHF